MLKFKLISQLIVVLWLTFGQLAPALSQPNNCDLALTRSSALLQQVSAGPDFNTSLRSWVRLLESDPKVVFVGQHRWVSNSAFLVSNEADWAKTPFDQKPSDLMIAFGTNSAWEIALDKDVKKLIIADWSPLPILVQAYVIAPLLRIAPTPQAFLAYLNADFTRDLSQMSINEAFQFYKGSRKFELAAIDIRRFLGFLAAQPNITDHELYFISEYLWARHSPANWYSSIFAALREPLFGHLSDLFEYRYSEVDGESRQKSALLNPFLYQRLRALYAEDRIQFAVTEVSDLNFYKKVAALAKDQRHLTLSLTNIFDMNYNNHSPETLRRLLQDLLPIFDINSANSLTVFGTTNFQIPHGFFRYELRSRADLEGLRMFDKASGF